MTKKSFEIAERVQAIREKIATAAARAGRSADEITLLGVTKTQSVENVRALIQAGVGEIGENRVQEMLEKEPFLSDIPHKIHLIGHMQRNKAKFLPTHVDMLQSVDSVKTVEALEQAYSRANEKLEVLIEVNIGEESNKNGVLPRDFPALVARLLASEWLILRGIMAIPPFGMGENIRRYFSQMYHLFIDIKSEKKDNVSILSMGMSADFEYAILEGATMVRVGTDLFGPRE